MREVQNGKMIFQRLVLWQGKGSSTEAQSYQFADKNLVNGIYYYRLKQIDFDGTFEYSPNCTSTNK